MILIDYSKMMMKLNVMLTSACRTMDLKRPLNNKEKVDDGAHLCWEDDGDENVYQQ